jgi:choline transport protein
MADKEHAQLGEVISETDGDISVVGSKEDAADMYRLGQKQELKRTFHQFSILGFSLIAVLTWPSVTGLAVYSLINGGLAVR